MERSIFDSIGRELGNDARPVCVERGEPVCPAGNTEATTEQAAWEATKNRKTEASVFPELAHLFEIRCWERGLGIGHGVNNQHGRVTTSSTKIGVPRLLIAGHTPVSKGHQLMVVSLPGADWNLGILACRPLSSSLQDVRHVLRWVSPEQITRRRRDCPQRGNGSEVPLPAGSTRTVRLARPGTAPCQGTQGHRAPGRDARIGFRHGLASSLGKPPSQLPWPPLPRPPFPSSFLPALHTRSRLPFRKRDRILFPAFFTSSPTHSFVGICNDRLLFTATTL